MIATFGVLAPATLSLLTVRGIFFGFTPSPYLGVPGSARLGSTFFGAYLSQLYLPLGATTVSCNAIISKTLQYLLRHSWHTDFLKTSRYAKSHILQTDAQSRR